MRIIIAFLITFNTLALVNHENPRLAAHEEAIEALSTLNFFTDGRGMTLTPDAVNMFDRFGRLLGLPGPDDKASRQNRLANRWGLNIIDGKIKGFYTEKYKKMNVGVLGCVVCHSGKAAGEYYIGLGNKNIDVGFLANDVVKATKVWRALTIFKKKSKEYKRIEKDSLDFAKRLADNRYNNLTQGLVPVSMIRQWFYRVVAKSPLPKNEPRGVIKVPHFWGYGKKRFVGQFTDGFGDGYHAGWGLAVELAGTQNTETIHKLMPKIEHAENILHDILPPKYPFKIDKQAAARGHKTYLRSCKKCHGTYEKDELGHPIYKEPKHVSINVVKTDEDRLKGNTEYFKQLVDNNPLNEYIRRNDFEPGYFAPRLEAVWARFPFLHNGSIPNLKALLTIPEKRPKFWSLEDAGEKHRFDENSLGLTLPIKGSRDYANLERRAKKGDRDVYSTLRIGQSNKGHWFRSMSKLNENEKKDLIEYLKTL